MTKKFSKQYLVDDIVCEARALGLHPGGIETIAQRVADRVEGWTTGRSEITEDDLMRVTARELGQYNKDLEYVYANRNKII